MRSFFKSFMFYVFLFLFLIKRNNNKNQEMERVLCHSLRHKSSSTLSGASEERCQEMTCHPFENTRLDAALVSGIDKKQRAICDRTGKPFCRLRQYSRMLVPSGSTSSFKYCESLVSNWSGAL